MTPKFTGTITNDKLLFNEPQQFQNYVNGLEGKDFELTLKVRRDPRTHNQLAYYWGVVVAIIAKDTGNDPEEVHEALKEMFAPQKIIRMGKHDRLITGCTHDLFKDDFFDNYIRKIQVWYAQEFGGVIPDPREVEL